MTHGSEGQDRGTNTSPAVNQVTENWVAPVSVVGSR